MSPTHIYINQLPDVVVQLGGILVLNKEKKKKQLQQPKHWNRKHRSTRGTKRGGTPTSMDDFFSCLWQISFSQVILKPLFSQGGNHGGFWRTKAIQPPCKIATINGFVSRYESGRGSWCGVVWWLVMAEYGGGATCTMANVVFLGTN